MLLWLRPALNIQRADHRVIRECHLITRSHVSVSVKVNGCNPAVRHSSIQLLSVDWGQFSGETADLSIGRHKHFPQKSQYLSGTAGEILYKFALSPKYHPFLDSTGNTEHSPLLSDLGRPPTLICQQEKLFLSQLCAVHMSARIYRIAPLFMESKWNEITSYL